MKKDLEEQQTIGNKQNFLLFEEETFPDLMMEFLEKPNDVLPLLIIKVTSECNSGGCVDYVKQANLVASIAKRQNRVGLLNCIGPEGHLCELLPDHEIVDNTITIYLRNNKIYVYEGEHTKEGLLEYFSADNWMESKVLEDDLEKYLEILLELDITWSEWVVKKLD